MELYTIDKFLIIFTTFLNSYLDFQYILVEKTLDYKTLYNIIKSEYFNLNITSISYLYIYNYLDIYYNFIMEYNLGLYYTVWNKNLNIINYFTIFWFFLNYLK